MYDITDDMNNNVGTYLPNKISIMQWNISAYILVLLPIYIVLFLLTKHYSRLYLSIDPKYFQFSNW